MTVTGKATATVNGRTVAETDAWEVVEGNVYFPPSSLRREFFSPSKSGLTTVCPWKGTASYYDVVVDDDGTELSAAAWYYPEVKDKAKEIRGYVAFCEFTLLPLVLWVREC